MGDENTPDLPELTTPQALALTKKIRNHVESAWALLLEARDRGAWKRLGHASFEAYVVAEFDMTRGNAYKLIAQGEVIAALEAQLNDLVRLGKERLQAVQRKINNALDVIRRG